MNDKMNDNQLKIIKAKYLKRDNKGKIMETVDEMFWRVSKEVSSVDEEPEKYGQIFYDIISSLEFIPGGRTLANAGTKVNNLSNCFVIPVEDSMEGIFEAVKKGALIQKRGGGVGYCFSTLRPEGAHVSGCNGTSSGPISFMKVFDTMCGTIQQGNRRGAQMATFHVSHPDIEKFISAKDDLTQLTNFNISVMLDNEFILAVRGNNKYNLIDPHTKEVVRQVNAKDLFDKIAHHAWKTGEPGVLFDDIANKHNTLKEYEKFKATNPCAEIWLLNHEVCNLASINLDLMVKNGEVNFERIKELTKLGVRFLDNVISCSRFPTKETEHMAKQTRRIGLGVLGFADMLYQLGIGYHTEEARMLALKIMKTISKTGWDTSEELAIKRGVFPLWDKSEFRKCNTKVRNCAITAIAPTGTLSMVADTSGGCEPNFALAYRRVSPSTKQSFQYFNKHLKKTIMDSTIKNKEQLVEDIYESGTIPEYAEDWLKEIFKIAYNITPREHILMQEAFQRYTDNSVSKTINLPKEATIEDVKSAYLLAWDIGCKGCTVYRDGSRENQVLSTNGDN